MIKIDFPRYLTNRVSTSNIIIYKPVLEVVDYPFPTIINLKPDLKEFSEVVRLN